MNSSELSSLTLGHMLPAHRTTMRRHSCRQKVEIAGCIRLTQVMGPCSMVWGGRVTGSRPGSFIEQVWDFVQGPWPLNLSFLTYIHDRIP
jgi:hypothetical protein